MKVAVRARRFIHFQSDLGNGVGFKKSLTIERMPNKKRSEMLPSGNVFGQFSCWNSVFVFSLIVLTEFQSLDSELMVFIEGAV